MAVNLVPPRAEDLLPISGVRLGIAQAHVRKPNRKDVLLVALDPGCRVAGVFTRNRFAAAPVLVCRENLASRDPMRAIVVNTGVANAGTGESGIADAKAVCAAVGSVLDIENNQVLPLSTGVIMEPLPVERIKAGLPQAFADLAEDHWASAAEAIMTTDTVAKAVSRQVEIDGKIVTVTGISKGAGMIEPNMATMLGIIATDACIGLEALQYLARYAADQSFNAITIDGDTSTNDTLLLAASGRAGNPEIIGSGTAEFGRLATCVVEVAQWLAQAIVRDGEGATKFITVRVDGGRSADECRKVAYAVAHSPLVKTAFFASDPNLGRILAAIGHADVADLNVETIDVYLDDVLVAAAGARYPGYQEADGQRVMKADEITVRVVLNRGNASATVWTCDLSHEYVSINADYRS